MIKVPHTNYNTLPQIAIKGFGDQVWQSYQTIVEQLTSQLNGARQIIVIETFPGVYKQEVINGLANLNFTKIFDTDLAMKGGQELTDYFADEMTDDRVFGHLTFKNIEHLINPQAKEAMELDIANSKGNILLIGMGASLFAKADILIYADMARWEIQMRFRNKTMANYNCDNYGEDTLRMYKRAFFIEWRIADRLKRRLWNSIDFWLDTNVIDQPKLVSAKAFFSALNHTVTRPFSTVPYFDPGLWGGQWMKQVCQLDPSKPNYAWSFNGVPEENSLLYNFDGVVVEMPALNLVFYKPIELLGQLTYARYGAEFPMRFDFLDTMDGGHLSLQVHPLTDYMQQNFGMHYTQDESYYMLDTGDDATVYLGLCEDCDVQEMFGDLERANNGEKNFDDQKYVNCFPAKKHDHFLIPAGTMHASGKNGVVLEISSTPYIFTFKMWDWGRVGMDGRPRPVHLAHARNVVVENRRTRWVNENLVNRVKPICSGDGFVEESTGLAEYESIETRRTWFEKPVTYLTYGTVTLLSLIEGSEATITSTTNTFEPMIIHYAECIIIPANCIAYTITPKDDGKSGLIRAYIRGSEMGVY